ncbi:MAG TPA: 50S ribosomal protein L22 [Candidatus Acidoferrales bacterium]|nr:50S ribosomal protein L22 [Candidatus Acidoferrales bacterium]
MATQPIIPQAIEGRSIVRYSRVSPQKARLVMDLIRGQGAEHALNILRFTKKRVAHDIEKILRSAIANAERKAEDSGSQLDVDHLYVSECFVNEGSRWKRVRPAPFGRAFRYQKRTSHITVTVAERHRAATQRLADLANEAERSKGVRGAVRRAGKVLGGKPVPKAAPKAKDAAKAPKAEKPAKAAKPVKKDQE